MRKKSTQWDHARASLRCIACANYYITIGYVCRYFLGISMKYVEIPWKYTGSTLDLETPKYWVFPGKTWKYLGSSHYNNMR